MPPISAVARQFTVHPAVVDTDEEFEILANKLQPGDELILHGGAYSQNSRRAVTAKGAPDNPIVIRAAAGESPLLTRPADQRDGQNNIEFVDCAHLVIRGLRFQGGSSGVRFVRGHHVTFEDCEIFDTGNNALNMNSGNCDHFVIRGNHIHHTGLSQAHPTGMPRLRLQLISTTQNAPRPSTSALMNPTACNKILAGGSNRNSNAERT